MPNKREKCDCKKISCKEACDKRHTHKTFFCEVCSPVEEETMEEKPNKREKIGWIEKYRKLIDENWKEPEWYFERHDALIDFVKVLIGKTELFITTLLAEERKKLRKGRNL